MKLTLEHKFPVSREKLWEVLHDPDQIARFLPGCEKMEQTGPDRYAATLTVGVAAIKGTYIGTVEILDKDFPSSYRLGVEGQAAPGFVKGTALMTLKETEDGHTLLVVDQDAQVGGLIASVGQRFLTGIARQMGRQMLKNVEREVTR